ncbi:MAG: alanine racemase [Sphingobacteriales bacterium BACL12 MAG-120813-bin55]|jgi:alanine racemase|nr:MAG: alanine racemase [Sphingobacteriales bacterium BACL12 MAG-120813-bin55]
MLHTSYIEINAHHYRNNLSFIKSLLHPATRFSSVVKGNAYGHGIELFVPMAEQCGIDHFSVFSADEAERVRNVAGADTTIMIMGMLDHGQIEWAIAHQIEIYIFNLRRLQETLEIARRLRIQAKVHLELETGMNRTGLPLKELPQALEMFEQNGDALLFRGCCTHFAGAESIANYYRIKKQFNTFNSAVKRMNKNGIQPQQLHTACSAAAIRYPRTQMDMVRIGILQYGFFPSEEVLVHYLTRNRQESQPMKGILSWKSSVMEVKDVKKGEFIGYGNSYLANVPTRIALIPVGYGHGFNRSLSNQGRVLIRGQRVSVIGTVNMNMMSVDISDVAGVQPGDEVVIIGRQGEHEISVSSFSNFSDQLNYEMLTRLPANLPRRIVDIAED